jgi:5'-deoxynucleotidase YfbR-like HD superfamily hydrolase
MNRNDVWIQTYSGVKFYIYKPTPADVVMEDVARALSHLCRFTGHLKRFYSVAQHCVHCSEQVEGTAIESLWALLHDAHEAYIGDMNSPLKRYLNYNELYAAVPNGEVSVESKYAQAERAIDIAVLDKFSIVYTDKELERVKTADMRMLVTEATQLHKRGIHPDWGVDTNVYTPYEMEIQPWHPDDAMDRFLRRLKQLTRIS